MPAVLQSALGRRSLTGRPLTLDRSHPLSAQVLEAFAVMPGGTVASVLSGDPQRRLSSTHSLSDVLSTPLGRATATRDVAATSKAFAHLVPHSEPRSILAVSVRTGASVAAADNWLFRINDSATSAWGVQLNAALTKVAAVAYSAASEKAESSAFTEIPRWSWFTVGASHPGAQGDLKAYYQGDLVATRATTDPPANDATTEGYWAAEDGLSAAAPPVLTAVAVVFKGVLSDQAMRSIGLDPWQLFEYADRHVTELETLKLGAMVLEHYATRQMELTRT